MKRLLLIPLLIACGLMNAQNGGQANENSSVKIEFIGLTAFGQAIIQVTNKQECEASIRIDYGNKHRSKIVVPLLADTFLIALPSSMKVRAKAETNCGTTDYGQVECNVGVTSTPLKYKDFSVRQIPGTDSIEVKVTFYESYNVNHVDIETSVDGLNWFRAKIFFPENIVESKRYSVRARIARDKNIE